MSLIKCSGCGKKISDKADKCINCGTPISEMLNKKEDSDKELNDLKNYVEREKKLKRIVLIILAFIVLGVVLSKVINNIKNNNKLAESEKRWMEKSKGIYERGYDDYIKLDGKGNAEICDNISNCSYPTYSYKYPNIYVFSDNNNYVTECFYGGITNLRSYTVDGLICKKSNGESVSFARVENGEFVKTIKD